MKIEDNIEQDRLVVFKSGARRGGWYWHRVAHNGRQIGSGGQRYTRKWSAKRAARRANPGLPVEVSRVGEFYWSTCSVASSTPVGDTKTGALPSGERRQTVV